MLIEHDIPIRRVLIRSPGRRIRKLIGAHVWRSPFEGETRWPAARIVEHIASDLNLAQFPGASECMSSLLDTSCHNNVYQEALQLPTGHNKARRSFLSEILRPEGEGEEFASQLYWIVYIIQELWASRNGGREDSKKREEHVDSNTTRGTHEDLILQGLRILDKLARDQHNCIVIYSTKGLVSKIVAPVSSNSLAEDINVNASWIQVVDTSLKVVSRLMRAPGDTGREMRCQTADSSNAVRNLEAVLGLQSSSSCILELQMRAMEVLAQLFFHGSKSWAGKRSGDFIERVLHIFCTVEWMGVYLAEEKKIKIEKETSNQPSKAWGARAKEKMKLLEDKKMKSLEDKMKEAKEIASRLKEKAGEALAMLSMGSQSNHETIRSFPNVVHCLTEMLDSKSIKCKISATETEQAEMKIGCRISAAVILKHMCPHFTTTDDDYVTKTTLKKVLVELLQITTVSQAQESNTSTLGCWEHCITIIERHTQKPGDGGQDEQIQSHKQQCEERRLQTALLSLCAGICAKYSIKAPDLATTVAQQVSWGDFVGKLRKMVEENSHTTPACLVILKLVCQMVKELISDNQAGENIETKKMIIGLLSQVVVELSKASKTLAGVESCMLFAGTDGDCYGVPAKPLLSALVKQAEELLEQRKVALGINTPAGGP